MEAMRSAAARRPRAWTGFVRHVAVVGAFPQAVVGGLLSVREIVYNSSRF